ncbi:hypothetical protein [Paraburkholderia sp. UCT70]|uniref:hypothetical protein n=2 Tax=unclassified Paraburkholderia TaxID=2615204 RepID=UPI003D1A2CC2
MLMSVEVEVDNEVNCLKLTASVGHTPAPRITTTLPGCTRPSLIAAIESSDVEKRIASPVNAGC